MGLVEDLLLATRDSESPRRYYYWAALSTIAAAVKNQVWLVRQKGQLKLYPNIYVLLVGRSGLRKGPPINLARALATAVDNNKVITGRSSIEAIIEEAREVETKPNGGPPQLDSTIYLVASEFASFIISDPGALTQLTDLYDGEYHPTWTYRTRGHGREVLKNPNINLIGGSNETHLKNALPEDAIGGGFLARTFIIYADKKAHSDPGLTDGISTFESDFNRLRDQLIEISKMKGPFSYTPEAKAFYDEWYMKFDEQDHSEDETGTLERFHNHVLKVAMLISLSNRRDRLIEKIHMEEALIACESFVPGTRRVALGQSGRSISAPGTAVLIKALLQAPENKLLRSEALASNWQYFDSFELDKIAESLEAQKAIKIGLGTDSADGKREQIYILNPKVKERFEKKSNPKANDGGASS